MTVVLDLSGLSVVFISFDEPNAEANHAVLRAMVPGVVRVHGVKGFDAAHRKAAGTARTAHVITVDGDNVVTDPDFFTRRLRFMPQDLTSVISFSARSHHNALAYGNGGIKIWPRPLLASLRSHEATHDGALAVDFAWRVPYVQAQGVPSDSLVTASPFQAFRAGLREGVRLTMNGGIAAVAAYPGMAPAAALQRHIDKSALERLHIWCSVGRDVENGAFAMLGARIGCVFAMLEVFDIGKIADFGWVADFWSSRVLPSIRHDADLAAELQRYGTRLRNDLGLVVDDLCPSASAFAKSIYHPPMRLGTLVPR